MEITKDEAAEARLLGLAAGVAERRAQERQARAVVDFVCWRLRRWAVAVGRRDVDEVRGALVIADAAARAGGFAWEADAYRAATWALGDLLAELEGGAHAA